MALKAAGIQAQEPRASRLQFRARARSLTAEAVENARVDERSVVRQWVMRKTAHIFPTEDYGWLTPLFSERIARWSRARLATFGVGEKDRERALAAIRGKLDSDGELTRSDAMRTAEKAGVEVNIQVRTHLSVLTVVEGGACIGPTRGPDSVFVATREWIGEQRLQDPDRGIAELARRYVAAFAPATDRDFASWSGLPLGICRSGLEAIAGELRELRLVDGNAALAPKGWRALLPASPVVRLLGAYDTYLMGYASRGHAVSSRLEKRVLPGGGILRPTICVDGRFVGTWSSEKTQKKLRVTLEPFGRVDARLREAIEAEAADIARFEGMPEAAVEV